MKRLISASECAGESIDGPIGIATTTAAATTAAIYTLTRDCIMMIFTLVLDRAAICSVCKQWNNLALITSRLISPVMSLWDGVMPNTDPVYSDLDVWYCPDIPSVYQDLHLAKRAIDAPCIYRACAAGVHEVIVAVEKAPRRCQHGDCILMFSDTTTPAYTPTPPQHHDICFILACTHANADTICMLATRLDINSYVDVLLAGLKRAAASGRLQIVAVLLEMIPRTYSREIMEAAAHAYAHIETIAYIMEHIPAEFMTVTNLLPITRAMSRCDTVDNIYWFLAQIKGDTHQSEEACMMLEGAFWIACGIAHAHVSDCPRVFAFGMAIGAVHTDNVELFAQMLVQCDQDIGIFLAHAGECNSVAVAKYIVECGSKRSDGKRSISTAALNNALTLACGGLTTNATADYLATAGATACGNCGLDMVSHTGFVETDDNLVFLM